MNHTYSNSSQVSTFPIVLVSWLHMHTLLMQYRRLVNRRNGTGTSDFLSNQCARARGVLYRGRDDDFLGAETSLELCSGQGDIDTWTYVLSGVM
jgi:hypothetical protein